MNEWFAEPLDLWTVSQKADITLQVDEIRVPEELIDSEQVLRDLEKVDWAFTEDDTQYLSHDIHAYPAKFIPQIPAHLIARLSLPGELVLDPFGGSGTTAVEALRLNRRAISLDANPVASLLGKVKTTPPIKGVTDTELERLSIVVSSFLDEFGKRGDVLAQELTEKHRALIPDIPNIEKWFSFTSISELALLRHLILGIQDSVAQDIALLALSRIIVRVSHQESETRYVSKPKIVPPGFALKSFLADLHLVQRKVISTAKHVRDGSAVFHTLDTRKVTTDVLPHESVDLIVTSPPYPNAMDYHLYHRFRLYWLGYEPKELAHVEIGSHLKHQREQTGFSDYLEDMHQCLGPLHDALRPGRYAVFVVGDGVYKGALFHTAESLIEIAQEVGFEVCGNIERQIHKTKRSFIKAARRARSENIVILKKAAQPIKTRIAPPNYKMWDYEVDLRRRELEGLLGIHAENKDWTKEVTCEIPSYKFPHLRRLTFSHWINRDRTWQSLLENGDNTAGRRKEPKYVTHGIHDYKGKFYPQLAKSLMNIVGTAPGSTIMDPFCGSGTVLLEAYLNGFWGIGCDMHPLAAKISSAKVNILTVNRQQCDEVLSTFLARLEGSTAKIPSQIDWFAQDTLDEIFSWFPEPVVYKLNWILSSIESIGTLEIREFLQVLLSSIIRDVSQQEPRDLRIRRRKEPLGDAPVIELFAGKLRTQLERLRAYWSISTYQPHHPIPPRIISGDNRDWNTFARLGLGKDSVDLVITSPPYATALPYIDTDRLSLLVLFGMKSQERGILEKSITGSREITNTERASYEDLFHERERLDLPPHIVNFVKRIHDQNQLDNVGFRRKNRPALLMRYFLDMKAVLHNLASVLKPTADMFVVVGDSKTRVDGEMLRIPTTEFLVDVAESCGISCIEQIPISVTTENLKHIKNAIVENTILHFRRGTYT